MSKLFDKTLNTHYQGEKQMAKKNTWATAVVDNRSQAHNCNRSMGKAQY